MIPRFTITEDLFERMPPVQPPIASRCDWLEEIAQQFRAIASLPDVWDGEGASHVDIPKLDAAWGLIALLGGAGGVPKPHVSPTPSGGVQFDWEYGGRYFEIELVAERAAVYLFRDDDAGIEEDGEIFEDDVLNPIIQYVKRVDPGCPPIEQ